MKKILIMFLLGTMTMFSQSTTIRGVNLKYDKVKKTMTLSINPKTMYTDDIDLEVSIEIYLNFILTSTQDGVTSILNKPYFSHKGHMREMGWFFMTLKPGDSKMIEEYYVYRFYNIRPNNEYILVVKNVCNDKFVTEEETSSIIIK